MRLLCPSGVSRLSVPGIHRVFVELSHRTANFQSTDKLGDMASALRLILRRDGEVRPVEKLRSPQAESHAGFLPTELGAD